MVMSDVYLYEFRFDRIIAHDCGEIGNAEPYLWQVYFKIDGETMYYDTVSNSIQGQCKIVPTNGRHGNIPEMEDGDENDIPEDIGYYSDFLVPIPFVGNFSIQGFAGSLTILMEEDLVSDHGAECGYQALIDTLQEKLDSVMHDKFDELFELYFTEGDEGLNEYFENLKDEITDAIKKNVKEAIKEHQNWFQNFGSWLDPDNEIGSELKLYNTNDISPTLSENLDYRWNNEGDWEIKGNFTGLLIYPDEGYHCPVSSFTNFFKKEKDPANLKILDGVKGNFKLLRDFRTSIFGKYPGFGKWWRYFSKHTGEWLLISLHDKKIKEISLKLFSVLPHLAKYPEEKLSEELFLELIGYIDLLDRKANAKFRHDLARARNLLDKCKGMSTREMIELMSSIPIIGKKRGK